MTAKEILTEIINCEGECIDIRAQLHTEDIECGLCPLRTPNINTRCFWNNTEVNMVNKNYTYKKAINTYKDKYNTEDLMEILL